MIKTLRSFWSLTQQRSKETNLASTMTPAEFAEAIKTAYRDINAAAADIGLSKQEITNLMLKQKNPPERVARKLRYRLISRVQAVEQD